MKITHTRANKWSPVFSLRGIRKSQAFSVEGERQHSGVEGLVASTSKSAEPCRPTCRFQGKGHWAHLWPGPAPQRARPCQALPSGLNLLTLAPPPTSPDKSGYFQPPLSDRKCLEFHSRRQQLWRIWGWEQIPATPPCSPPHMNALTYCVWKLLSRVRHFATPWTLPPMGFSRQEYWSG